MPTFCSSAAKADGLRDIPIRPPPGTVCRTGLCPPQIPRRTNTRSCQSVLLITDGLHDQVNPAILETLFAAHASAPQDSRRARAGRPSHLAMPDLHREGVDREQASLRWLVHGAQRQQ